MSEKQETHTPGPWELVQERDYLNLQEKDTNLVIAQFISSSDEDARLIAAAPDMHEVLSELLDTLEMSKGYGFDDEYEKVRAILAKVEGETA